MRLQEIIICQVLRKFFYKKSAHGIHAPKSLSFLFRMVFSTRQSTHGRNRTESFEMRSSDNCLLPPVECEPLPSIFFTPFARVHISFVLSQLISSTLWEVTQNPALFTGKRDGNGGAHTPISSNISNIPCARSHPRISIRIGLS